jgi:SAM-dependent methyltransferase
MKCRICGSSSFGNVIDLGDMPLVNNLLSAPDAEAPRWPLQVVYCQSCSLVQITEAPPPQIMFDEYCYFSSQSQTMVDHARRLVDRFVQPGQRVLEIASNDGYLLKQAAARGAGILGIDPARNVAAHAEARGVPTRVAYFNATTARAICDVFGPADVLFALNVLAHVPDPNEIAAGIATVLADTGIAHIEVPSVLRLIEQCAFDTIYHEHHSYFSLSALLTLFRRHGLRVIGVEELPIHGGSFHVRIARSGDESDAEAMARREREIGLFDDAYYRDFSRRVLALKDELLAALDRFSRVCAFGAAAKGIVLLNYFGLGADRIAWVADVSPHKQGRFVPGTRQPIVEPPMLLREQPDACIILPWNIRDEIRQRNCEYEQRGGRFVVAIPEVVVL